MAVAAVRVARGVALAVGAVWLLVLPVITQVSERPLPYVRQWHMYSGVATQICQVEFWVYENGAPSYQIDRMGVLRAGRVPLQRPAQFLPDAAAIDRQAATLCRLLRADDVRAVARCASRTTWQKVHDREASLCPGKRR